MSDLRFKSSLSMEEIENNFKDVDFFEGIMEGLKEALAHKEELSRNPQQKKESDSK